MSKKRPKIIIFHCAFIYTGGGERIVLEQTRHLLERGYDVSCFAPVVDKNRCYPDIISQFPVKSLLPQLPAWFPFGTSLQLLVTCTLAPLLAFRFRDTDLFIGENQPGTWLAYVCARVLKKPYLIYTCHPNKMIYPRKLSRKQIWKNEANFYWLSIFFEPFKNLLRWLDKTSFTSSGNTVLTNGYFIGNQFHQIYQTPWQGCPSGAPFVKPESRVLKNNNVWKGAIRAGGLKIKKPYLLYVGRHEVWKRIDLGIKVFSKLVKKYPDVRLVIRGPFSTHTHTLKKLARRLGLESKVIFSPEKGDQASLKKLYFNAAVYVFPSKKEDFGIVIVEAMGAGVPVVAWNSGGPKDIVVDGQTGFLVKPFDLDDFAAKVWRLLKNKKLRQQMSKASWRRVRDNFSWQKHADILETQIKKALKDNYAAKID